MSQSKMKSVSIIFAFVRRIEYLILEMSIVMLATITYMYLCFIICFTMSHSVLSVLKRADGYTLQTKTHFIKRQTAAGFACLASHHQGCTRVQKV